MGSAGLLPVRALDLEPSRLSSSMGGESRHPVLRFPLGMTPGATSARSASMTAATLAAAASGRRFRGGDRGPHLGGVRRARLRLRRRPPPVQLRRAPRALSGTHSPVRGAAPRRGHSRRSGAARMQSTQHVHGNGRAAGEGTIHLTQHSVGVSGEACMWLSFSVAGRERKSEWCACARGMAGSPRGTGWGVNGAQPALLVTGVELGLSWPQSRKTES